MPQILNLNEQQYYADFKLKDVFNVKVKVAFGHRYPLHGQNLVNDTRLSVDPPILNASSPL